MRVITPKYNFKNLYPSIPQGYPLETSQPWKTRQKIQGLTPGCPYRLPGIRTQVSPNHVQPESIFPQHEKLFLYIKMARLWDLKQENQSYQHTGTATKAEWGVQQGETSPHHFPNFLRSLCCSWLGKNKFRCRMERGVPCRCLKEAPFKMHRRSMAIWSSYLSPAHNFSAPMVQTYSLGTGDALEAEEPKIRQREGNGRFSFFKKMAKHSPCTLNTANVCIKVLYRERQWRFLTWFRTGAAGGVRAAQLPGEALLGGKQDSPSVSLSAWTVC